LVKKAVAAAKRGDRDGVHFLYARFAEDIQRYVRSFVKDHHQAEDITQDVFIKLMRVIGKYEEREVPFSAWILRVARNAALDHLRVQRAVPQAEIHLADDEQGQISRERGRALRDALRQLPDDQREVLVLRHILGLSPTEIATVLGRTESSVHGLHHRGRLTFRSALRDFGAAPVTTAQRSL
jgi:RNA polymerase sigma-70 factor (ECF subfamily)